MRLASFTKRAGFTLAELLVSITVLALVILFVMQMMEGASRVATASRKHLDADAQARLIFDTLATDFSRMVRRGDVDFYGKDSSVGRTMTGNDQIAFYSVVTGYYSSPSPTATPTLNQRNPISLVAYTVSNDPSGRPQLVRLSKGLVWQAANGFQDLGYLPLQIVNRWPNLFSPSSGSPPPTSGMADTDFEPIADSVLRFEYHYLLRSVPTAAPPRAARISTAPFDDQITGHSSADFHTDVASIVVTVAILDPMGRAVVSDYSHVTSNQVFADSNGSDMAPIWMGQVNALNFASNANLPQTAASVVRVYEHEFPFTSAGP